MSVRSRFWLIAAFLMLTLAICVAVRVEVIGRDLLVRTQDALAASGLAFYGVEISGRDALLHGFVSSRERADEIGEIVRGVRGIRAVTDRMTVERIAAPAQVVRRPARLRLQILGDRLVMSGTLPSAAAVDALREAAQQRFGNNVQSSLRINSAVAAPDWLQDSAALMRLLAGAAGNARLSIQGTTGLFFAQVRDAAARARLAALAAEIEALQIELDIVALDGTTGGGGP